MTTIRSIALAMAVLPLLAACGRGTDSGYFPLQEGRAWEYAVEYKVRGEMRRQKLIYRNAGHVETDGKTYYARIGLNGHRDFYRKTKAGIDHVDPVSGKRYRILAYPLKQGQEWQSDSKIKVLEVTGAFTPTFKARIVKPVTLTYHLEDTGATVTVPAGTFSQCLQIHAKGYLFAGRTLQDMMGIDTINIEQTEWYAPGVGLVKTEREEYTEPNEFRNRYTRELLTYEE